MREEGLRATTFFSELRVDQLTIALDIIDGLANRFDGEVELSGDLFDAQLVRLHRIDDLAGRETPPLN